ncbi:unnamed protein product [Moneuplotes crassus]|uniref:Uncharacterized protein n=1 Tax=Euplotes crassus TaxID=5936 RepID=A0AAD1XSC9_EUPCR|nr:unnamed protein product [Moneuplotes crassus]
MFYDDISLFGETPFDDTKLMLCEVPEIDKEDFGMLNDFPSVCELKPHEVIEKRCNREDTIDKFLKSSFLQDKIFEEDDLSKNQFSLSTEEVLENPEKKNVLKTSPTKKSKKPQASRREGLRKRIVKKKPKKPKIAQKVKSFENRTRFCKKHDREMFLVLNRLCKESGISPSEFEGTEFPLSENLMEILEQLITEINWRRSRKIPLLSRIRKLMMDKAFSIRDVKLLTALATQHQSKYGFIDYEAIMYYFPGKTTQALMKAYEDSLS